MAAPARGAVEEFLRQLQLVARWGQAWATEHRVRALCDSWPVADHERIWARHQTISADEHGAAARVGLLCPPPPANQVEIRPLSDYDTALGLTDGGVA